jgi:hypothetical protein|tara:strand:- start:450 stop:1400 length:951 start_codon:yes stop_codon:yes gene_type:complete
MDKDFMGLDGFIWFTGVVEDRDDPAKLGRVKVRCLGFHTEDKVDIPTADLPWAHVMHPVTDPSMQGLGNSPTFLVEGSWVVGFFRDAEEKQQPIVIGSLPGVPETVADKTKGFNDPNGNYPSSEISHSGHSTEESDVNRLARNETDKAHSVVKTKDDAKTSSIATANSTTMWSEPSSAYAATYPKNHVFESESGHIKEFDDTTDNERIHEYHTKGTFYEIDKDGNKSTRVVGDNYQVVAGNDYVNIKGNCNLTIDTNCNTYIKGNWNIQVDGTKTEVVTGAVTETYKANQTTNITGTLDLDASVEVDIDSKLINLN